MSKIIRHIKVGIKDDLSVILERYGSFQKIEDAEVYWNDKLGIVCVLTSQEWKDYLLDIPKINSESQNQ